MRTAEAWLHDVLDHARRDRLPGMVRTAATFADAASEWLRFIEEDRERKPSTLNDYRSGLRAHLLPAFGDGPADTDGARIVFERVIPPGKGKADPHGACWTPSQDPVCRLRAGRPCVL